MVLSTKKPVADVVKDQPLAWSQGENVLQIDILKGHLCKTDANAAPRPLYPYDRCPGPSGPEPWRLQHHQREDVGIGGRLHSTMGGRPATGRTAAAGFAGI